MPVACRLAVLSALGALCRGQSAGAISPCGKAELQEGELVADWWTGRARTAEFSLKGVFLGLGYRPTPSRPLSGETRPVFSGSQRTTKPLVPSWGVAS